MKLAIDITDCINGWRVDILSDIPPSAQVHKENFVTSQEAFIFARSYILSKMNKKPPYNTMEVC